LKQLQISALSAQRIALDKLILKTRKPTPPVTAKPQFAVLTKPVKLKLQTSNFALSVLFRMSYFEHTRRHYVKT